MGLLANRASSQKGRQMLRKGYTVAVAESFACAQGRKSSEIFSLGQFPYRDPQKGVLSTDWKLSGVAKFLLDATHKIWIG